MKSNQGTPYIERQTFVWSGIGPVGDFQRGTIDAININIASNEIESNGVAVKTISLNKTRQAKNLLSTRISMRGNSIKPRNTAIFIRQLATLIQAGIPILQSLEVLAEGSGPGKKAIGKIAEGLGQDILAGSTLAEACSNHPKVFNPLTQQLINAGEVSGTLDIILHNIARHQEKAIELKRKIRKALVHPLSVLSIAAIVTALMLTKVVPQFEQMFRSQGKTLPAMTAFVIDLSASLQAYWGYGLCLILILTISFRQIYQTQPAFTLLVDKTLLGLPLFGNLIRASCVARFSRTLATTYTAGIPIPNALAFAGPVSGNLVYQRAVKDIQQSIAQGEALAEAITGVGCFPNLLIKMITIGEQGGVLQTMLEKSASHYENEVENTIEKILPLLEPAMMALLGLLLGGLITALYLPVFQMGTVLSG